MAIHEEQIIWTYQEFFYQVLNTFSQVDDERFEDTLPSDVDIGILQRQVRRVTIVKRPAEFYIYSFVIK